MQVVITQLAAILKTSDAEIGDTGTWPGRIKKDVERWLSDWHLVTFLCMQGLFSLVSEDGRPKALFCGTDSRIFFPFFFFLCRRSNRFFVEPLPPTPIRMTLTRWKSFSLVVDGRHCSPLSTLKLPVSFFFFFFGATHLEVGGGAHYIR